MNEGMMQIRLLIELNKSNTFKSLFVEMNIFSKSKRKDVGTNCLQNSNDASFITVWIRSGAAFHFFYFRFQ